MKLVIKNCKHRNFVFKDLLKKMKVEVICTTDDPADSLEYHQAIGKSGFTDQSAAGISSGSGNGNWRSRPVSKIILENWANRLIFPLLRFHSFLDALKNRHDFFHSMGCRVSDHGLEQFYEVEWTESELKNIFDKVSGRKNPGPLGNSKISISHCSFNLLNGIMKKTGFSNFISVLCVIITAECSVSLGPDTGWDSIGDFPQAAASVCLSEFPGQK